MPPGVGVEAGQKLAPRSPLRLLDGSLQGPPRFAIGLIQSSYRGFVFSPPTAGSGVTAPSIDARLAETSDLLGPPVHRAATAWGPGPWHTRVADRMQVAPQPGLSRLRVLVGRRFFRPGDGYSGRRHEVLVTMGRRPPRESSSPSRWANCSARIERSVAYHTPNRHLQQNVEVVGEGLLWGHAPSGNMAGSGWTCPRVVRYGLAPPHHARAGRHSVHKPEVECGRPVLHVAPPSVGPTGAPCR